MATKPPPPMASAGKWRSPTIEACVAENSSFWPVTLLKRKPLDPPTKRAAMSEPPVSFADSHATAKKSP